MLHRNVRFGARRAFHIALAIGFAAIMGCGEKAPVTGEGTLTETTVIEGASQTATVGQAVAVRPAVRVNVNGAPRAGISVTFIVNTGGGSVTGGSVMTDASGVARVGSWTLGTTVGTNSLYVIVGSAESQALFTATGVAGPAAAISKQAGDAQSAFVNNAVAIPPGVRVTDQYNNPVSGATVTFAVTQGGGTLAGGAATSAVTTDASGIATVASWTVGTITGPNALSASIASGPSVVFTANGATAAPTMMVKLAGDAQTGTVGQQLSVRPSVKITDMFGNPVSGASVTFTPENTSSGTVVGATQVTGADGIATITSWTLGNTAGTQALTVSFSILYPTARFTASARAGALSAVVKVSGDLQSATVGTNLSNAVAVRTADEFGNGISGVNVNFAVTQGGGALTGTTVTSGADGVAALGSWKLGNVAGANRLTATAISNTALVGNPATFTATGVAGPATSLIKEAGDNQTGAAGSQLTISPSVKLTDQFGNVLTGAAVTFALASGGGTLTGATPNTNALGIATVGGWTLGQTPGANTITASVGSLNVLFTATALANLNAPQYAGTYQGSWVNTTFGSTNTASATIAVNAQTSTVTLTASANGNVLGGGPVGPTTRNTTFSPTNGSFTGNVPPMGDITGTFTSTANTSIANFQATGTNVPGVGINRWTITGTITPNQINLTFTVFFTSGSTAVGTIVLNKTS